MIWTLPNCLTMARVAAAPGLLLAFAAFDRPAAGWIAFVLFVGAAATDFLDGWLARRWGMTSALGAMLDPIADKAMVITALAVLVGLYGFDWWFALPVAVILLREVLVSGLREYLGDIKLPVTALAKWKTAVQMVAIGMLLVGPPTASYWLVIGIRRGEGGLATGADAIDPAVFGVVWAQNAGIGMLWIAAALTAVTGWDYFRKGLAYMESREGR